MSPLKFFPIDPRLSGLIRRLKAMYNPLEVSLLDVGQHRK